MNNNFYDNNCEMDRKDRFPKVVYIGVPGPTGPTGPTGDGGATSVTVGTTTTTEPTTDANVVNSGTAEDLVLDFFIPRGATGKDKKWH